MSDFIQLVDYCSFGLKEYTYNTQRHFDLHGIYGLSNNSMWWLWPVFLGRIFRIGRLNYEISYYHFPFHILTNDNDQILLLAGDLDQRYDDKGYESAQGTHVPVFEVSDQIIRGHRFNPDGTLHLTPVKLDRSQWSFAIRKKDPVLSIHIPRDGKLDPRSVQTSLDKAVPFFKQYFSEIPFRWFICHSWLLNTNLSDLLLPDSNILSFQSLFTIALANEDKDALYAFIFDVPPCPLDNLIPQTSFHRNVLSFIRGGGILRDGFGVFPFSRPSDNSCS